MILVRFKLSVLRTVLVYFVIHQRTYMNLCLENRHEVQFIEPYIVIELFSTSLLVYFLALISQIWRSIAGMKVVDCLVLSFVIITNTLLIIITINTINFFYIRMDYKLSSEGVLSFLFPRFC